MKLLHLLIVIIPVIISIIAIAIYIVPYVLPVQPLSVQIIGYKMYVCNNSTNSCMSSTPILFGNGSNVFHNSDHFLLVVSVTNPNFFPIHFDSASTTFDKNAINYQYWGCAGGSLEMYVGATGSNDITIPNSDCEVFIANSIGETNATVLLQYKINGIEHSASTSKTFTVIPKT